jgi:hypothetical protein
VAAQDALAKQAPFSLHQPKYLLDVLYVTGQDRCRKVFIVHVEKDGFLVVPNLNRANHVMVLVWYGATLTTNKNGRMK